MALLLAGGSATALWQWVSRLCGGGSSGYPEGQEGETRRRSMGWKLEVRHKASRTTLSCWIVLKGLETWVSLALVMPLRGPHLTSPVKYGQYHVVARCEAQMKEHHAS